MAIRGGLASFCRIDPIFMLRLVDSRDAHDDTTDPLPDYRKQRAYRTLDRLLSRVLQLDQILHHDASFNNEKAQRIKQQIRRTQDKLDRVYAEIDNGRARRSTLRCVDG